MADEMFLPPAADARIVSTPDVRGGRPCVEGTRITVSNIISALREEGITPVALCTHFVRRLTPAQIEAAIAYAETHPDEMAREAAEERAAKAALQARIERNKRQFGVFPTRAAIPESIRAREMAMTPEGWVPLLPEEERSAKG